MSQPWFKRSKRGRVARSATQSSQSSDGSFRSTRMEGEDYLSTPPVRTEDDDFDVLLWWQTNQTTFPRLAQVAKDILAIPVSQVGVERVFNTARDVIGDRRHRLSPQTIRQLVVLKHALLEDTLEDTKPQAEAADVTDLFELPAADLTMYISEDNVDVDEDEDEDGDEDESECRDEDEDEGHGAKRRRTAQ